MLRACILFPASRALHSQHSLPWMLTGQRPAALILHRSQRFRFSALVKPATWRQPLIISGRLKAQRLQVPKKTAGRARPERAARCGLSWSWCC